MVYTKLFDGAARCRRCMPARGAAACSSATVCPSAGRGLGRPPLPLPEDRGLSGAGACR